MSYMIYIQISLRFIHAGLILHMSQKGSGKDFPLNRRQAMTW